MPKVGIVQKRSADFSLSAPSAIWKISKSFRSTEAQAVIDSPSDAKNFLRCILSGGVAMPDAQGKNEEDYSAEEIARRYEDTLKRVLTTPPQHRTARGDKANPPKKRGRPTKDKSPSSDEDIAKRESK